SSLWCATPSATSRPSVEVLEGARESKSTGHESAIWVNCAWRLMFRSKESSMDIKARKPYPSDLTDDQWAIIEPLLPPPVAAGAPRKTNLREVLNAIFYVLSTGCAWSALPHDFPPEGTVRDYFHQWRRRGLWQQIHDALRGQVRVAA